MTTRKFKREHEDIEVAQDRANAKQVEKSTPSIQEGLQRLKEQKHIAV